MRERLVVRCVNKHNKFLFLFSFLLFVQVTLLAQNKQQIITGNVIDQTGLSVIGANVSVKGTTNGTVTDIDGNFTLTLTEKNPVLLVSYIGYTPQEIPVGNQTDFKIKLLEDTQKLNEVVVIGYGSVAKKELTSAVSHVSSKDFLNVGAIDPAMQIQGKVAGVSITNNGAGDPNGSASIQVRGVSSRSAGLGPLIVIDGVPGGNLQNINENDIASIDVLKDGAASAIYGTRGSNGVILVTTKKGSADGAFKTTYTGYASFDMVTNSLKTLSASEFREKRIANKQGDDFGSDVDWMKELTRTGITHNHSLTIAGGTAKNNYRATVDARQAQGIDLRSDRVEYGARFSFNHTAPNDLYKISLNAAPRVVTKNHADWGGFQQALLANPTFPVMDTDDASGRQYSNFDAIPAEYNPVETARLEKNGTEAKMLDWDATFRLNLLPLLASGGSSIHTLNTQATIAQQINDDTDYWFRPSLSTQAQKNGYKGEAKKEYKKNLQQSFEWLANYMLDYKGHSAKFMGGYSYQYFQYQNLYAENKDFTSDVFEYNNLGDGAFQKEEGRLGIGSSKNDSKLIAFFGRLSYDYLQRYLITASLRYEGSSKFGANNKWGYFPAVSAGWRISEEDFMKDIKWIDDLKVRGDFGITGNQNFDSYRSLATYGGFGDVYYNGSYVKGWAPNKNVNPDLKWEKGVNWNLGVDFSFFNRVYGSINYYNRSQKDLLGDYNVPVPPYLFEQKFVNVGTMKNTGVEIELTVDAVKQKDFSYTIGFVGASNNNKFTDFSNATYTGQDYYWTVSMPGPGTPGSLQQIRKGERVGTFVTWAYAGLDETGNWLVWNKDNTKQIPVNEAKEEDKRPTGNGLPKFTASLNNTFRYKNWDLSLFFRGAFGYDLFNVHEFYYGLQSASANSNVLQSAYEKNAAVKTGMNVLTDYFIEKGDYVKLDVVTLGFTTKINSRWIERCRVYATGKNLFTITGFSGVNPDTYPTNGMYPGVFTDNGSGTKNYYPSTTQLLIGVQLDF